MTSSASLARSMSFTAYTARIRRVPGIAVGELPRNCHSARAPATCEHWENAAHAYAWGHEGGLQGRPRASGTWGRGWDADRLRRWRPRGPLLRDLDEEARSDARRRRARTQGRGPCRRLGRGVLGRSARRP